MPKSLTYNYFARDTVEVARSLVGTVLEVGECRGRIVEVEAYADDEASHGHRRTERSALMHDTFGHVYVYFIYGMYHCLNFTTDRRNTGAVLIRAVEPLTGVELMKRRRGVDRLEALASGPGKLCQAFEIDLTLNGSRVGEKLKLYSNPSGEIAVSPRIGITRAVNLPWRFYEKGNPHVSRGATRR